MRVIDLHCDTLLKLVEKPELSMDHATELDLSEDKIRNFSWYVQCFAIYLPERIAQPDIRDLLRSIIVFREKVLSRSCWHWIQTRQDLNRCKHEKKWGAMLTLEGVDALQGEVKLIDLLFQLGLRCVGLTWNHSNWAADGIQEPRGGGLTRKGIELVKRCNKLGLVLDVSHLSVRGFWDVSEHSSAPFIASHSNVKALCSHPRNLNRDQIKEIILRDGRIGINFVPYFLSDKEASITDVLRHIDYICGMGGEDHIGFGSDFDGIDQWTPGLEHAGKYEQLMELLIKHFGIERMEKIMWKNMYRFFEDHLPDEKLRAPK